MPASAEALTTARNVPGEIVMAAMLIG